MAHHQHDGFSHSHEHEGVHEHLDPAKDLTVPDDALDPRTLGRRGFLRSAGLLGAGVASVGVMGANGVFAGDAAAHPGPPGRPDNRGGFRWLAGDHHIHTQYSSGRPVPGHRPRAARQRLRPRLDGHHRPRRPPARQASASRRSTPTSSPPARSTVHGHPGLPGPGVEHPGRRARHGVRAPGPATRSRSSSSSRTATTASSTTRPPNTPANEAIAVTGLNFLAEAGAARCGADALMLANHPARKGIDSPHEIRGWRDAAAADRHRHGGRAGPPGRRHPDAASARASAAATTTTARARTRSPATRWRATAPGAASTG